MRYGDNLDCREMLELFQITNDPMLASRCDAIGGLRLFVDLERLGKAERQAGRNTFISEHTIDDIGRLRKVLRKSSLMVRVNPLNSGSGAEIDAALAGGAQLLMLPMFTRPQELRDFARLVDGRARIVALLETASALQTLDAWIDTPDLYEVFVGLNDLHISLGQRFMFEPLADGTLDRVADAARKRGLRFGFGGIARMEEGELPGREVLAEHLRLGSGAVILSRAFARTDHVEFERDVMALREEEARLACRTPAQVESDRLRVRDRIRGIAEGESPVA